MLKILHYLSLFLFLPLSLTLFLITAVMIEAQNKNSSVLRNATIKTNKDQVNVTCYFRNDSSPTSQCVIVILKSTEDILMIDNYTAPTDFPVMLNISDAGSYSVAVFGRSDGVIESFPTELQQVDVTRTSQGSHYCMCLRMHCRY